MASKRKIYWPSTGRHSFFPRQATLFFTRFLHTKADVIRSAPVEGDIEWVAVLAIFLLLFRSILVKVGFYEFTLRTKLDVETGLVTWL